MKSVRLQLLVTAAAAVVSFIICAARGLPPNEDIFLAVSSQDIEQVRRGARWGQADAPCEVKGLGLRGYVLHFALANGLDDAAKVLIVNGADVNAKPFSSIPPLAWAVTRGNEEAAELLMARGADVNVVVTGSTLLHSAAAANQAVIAKLLIAHGAAVNARDDDGRTPLKIALERGSADVAALLRAHGAKE